MFLIIRGNETSIKNLSFESNEAIHIAEYGQGGLGILSNKIGMMTELYFQLCKLDTDSKLLNKIGHIIEMLNNLKHFYVGRSGKSEDEFVQEIMAKFESFEYRTLQNIDLSRDFKLFKVSNIENDEDEAGIIRGDSHEYGIKSEDCDKLDFNLISRSGTPRVVSIIENDETTTIIEEIMDGLRKLASSSSDRRYFQKYALFTVKECGVHSEIYVLINHLSHTLNYILNSYSFRNNGYYDFDAFEIQRMLDFDITETLKRFKTVAEYQLGQQN